MVKVFKRSIAGAAAAGIALVGLTATNAEADIVRCSRNTVASNWAVQCLRYTDDGDPGGVSGEVNLWRKSDGGSDAHVSFDADGEKVSAINNTDLTFYVEVDWIESSGYMHRDIFYKLEPGDVQDFNRSYPEGKQVQIDISTASGKGAAIKSLVS